MALSFSSAANAATAPADLGTTASYSVLGGSTVTNTGPTILSGDIGVSPGTAITGFPPGIVGGATHAADANAIQAQSDLVIAYNDVDSRAPTQSVSADLGGQTLEDGVYNSAGPLSLTGTLTLDGQGDPDSVFMFQAASTLITATNSTVNLINGADACNVYWQVGSSATLGTGTTFVGSILALTSISANTGATVQGRALARNGAVTLDTNVFTDASCAPVPTNEPTETPTEEPPPTEEPTETTVPTEEPTEAAAPMNPQSPQASAPRTDSDTPSGSDSPEGSDATDDAVTDAGTDRDAADRDMADRDMADRDTTEPAAPSGSEDSTREADASTAEEDDDLAEATSDSSDLATTGPGALTSALVGLSVLVILGGTALLIIRRQRLNSSN